jgi:hypothetical protein
MIARESFEKSLPRFASAAPFLCLIDDHLLCPTWSPPRRVEEALVDARVVRQLGMERRDENRPSREQHRLAVELGEHLDAGPTSRTRGARMKTPRSGSSPSSARSASKLATWRP